jgi:hypothetical protein
MAFLSLLACAGFRFWRRVAFTALGLSCACAVCWESLPGWSSYAVEFLGLVGPRSSSCSSARDGRHCRCRRRYCAYQSQLNGRTRRHAAATLDLRCTHPFFWRLVEHMSCITRHQLPACTCTHPALPCLQLIMSGKARIGENNTASYKLQHHAHHTHTTSTPTCIHHHARSR